MNQPLAYVHPGAKIAKNVVIEPFTTIHNNVTIGDGTWIGSNVTIMEGARIGKNCNIFPGAVISAIPQDLKFQDYFRFSKDASAYLFKDFSEVELYPIRGRISSSFHMMFAGRWKNYMEKTNINIFLDKTKCVSYANKNKIFILVK